MAYDLSLIESAKIICQSKMFPDIRTSEQAAVKIMAGKDLGISAFASIVGIHIIDGKPVLGANLMASLVKKAGYKYLVKELTDKGCSIEFLDKDGLSLGVSTFGEEDAIRGGLLSKKNWRTYPRNMYFARAISNGVKFFCPEVTCGASCYTPDEIGREVDQAGDVIEGKAESVVETATIEQQHEFWELFNKLKIDQVTLERWLAKADAPTVDDMPRDVIEKCIQYMQINARN